MEAEVLTMLVNCTASPPMTNWVARVATNDGIFSRVTARPFSAPTNRPIPIITVMATGMEMEGVGASGESAMI